jgi:hypothetical protein
MALRRRLCNGHRHLGYALHRNGSLLPALDRHHVADHLPRHCKCRPVGIASLQLALSDQRQFRRLSRRQLGRLDQCSLDVLVALFRYRHYPSPAGFVLPNQQGTTLSE